MEKAIRREIPPVPATRKTAENDDDEKDSQMTLNRSRQKQDQRGITVVAAKSPRVTFPAPPPICEICAICGLSLLFSRHLPELSLIHNLNPKLARFVQFASRILAGQQVIRFFGHA